MTNHAAARIASDRPLVTVQISTLFTSDNFPRSPPTPIPLPRLHVSLIPRDEGGSRELNPVRRRADLASSIPRDEGRIRAGAGARQLR